MPGILDRQARQRGQLVAQDVTARGVERLLRSERLDPVLSDNTVSARHLRLGRSVVVTQ